MCGATLSHTELVTRPRFLIPPPRRWYAKLGLLLLTTVLLTLSFAPVYQFYLAWIGLAPWLILLASVHSQRAAFLWSWLGGVMFFTANMWWLAYVTGPGMFALIALLGLYWAVAGLTIRGSGVLQNDALPPDSVGGAASTILHSVRTSSMFRITIVAVVWVGLEWLRGTWPLQGLPWLYLGHTQSPARMVCQIADIAGVSGISFWVAMVNAAVALAAIGSLGRVWAGGAGVLGCVVVVIGYGAFRIHQTASCARPGPVVLVVQPCIPQSNSGSKGESAEEILKFHLDRTLEELKRNPHIDLVVWSETMMPPLNPGARSFALEHGPPDQTPFWEVAHRRISELARQNHAAILVGGLYYADWKAVKDEWVPADRRNSAYLYNPTGKLADGRYDKVHLVPFGEFLPFKSAFPPLYWLFLKLSPYTEEYTLTAGSPDALTVFELRPADDAAAVDRFVTPICFEDIDAGLVRRMFAPDWSGGVGAVEDLPIVKPKRAGFVVNITNDGWFKGGEMAQHLQASVFRAIENRAPVVRSVNTGISGFIDSTGRTDGLVAAGTDGASVRRLLLDSRVTFFTRFGDVFGDACAALSALVAIIALIEWFIRRSCRKTPAGSH